MGDKWEGHRRHRKSNLRVSCPKAMMLTVSQPSEFISILKDTVFNMWDGRQVTWIRFRIIQWQKLLRANQYYARHMTSEVFRKIINSVDNTIGSQ